MGVLHQMEDGALLSILGYLDARSLSCLASTCRALYCFANHEELWKSLTIQVN